MTDLTETDGVIALPERLDIAAGRALRDIILQDSRDLALDASAVTILTSPAAQVLLAARIHQQANSRKIHFTAVSRGLRNCARTLGLTLDQFQTEGGLT